MSPFQSSAQTALIGSLVLGVLTVLGIAAASAWVTRRALAPVARMTAAAADWTEHDLSRRFFAGDPHDELTELAATFDRLLDRLSQSLRCEQRFTAEISHELRTPLAKILAEAELAACQEAVEALGTHTPLGMLAFDCIARRAVLGDAGIKREIDCIATAVDGPGTAP